MAVVSSVLLDGLKSRRAVCPSRKLSNSESRQDLRKRAALSKESINGLISYALVLDVVRIPMKDVSLAQH
jgi:hypothetical protein